MYIAREVCMIDIIVPLFALKIHLRKWRWSDWFPRRQADRMSGLLGQQPRVDEWWANHSLHNYRRWNSTLQGIFCKYIAIHYDQKSKQIWNALWNDTQKNCVTIRAANQAQCMWFCFIIPGDSMSISREHIILSQCFSFSCEGSIFRLSGDEIGVIVFKLNAASIRKNVLYHPIILPTYWAALMLFVRGLIDCKMLVQLRETLKTIFWNCRRIFDTKEVIKADVMM